MTQNLCTRTERRLRRHGYDKKTAHRCAGFLFISMMSVCGLFGLLDGSPEVLYHMGNGAGISYADARSGSVLSAAFRLRRH